MSSLELIRASIDDEIATCAERVRDLLAQAGGLSEREVMAAGECVGAVKAEARANVDALRDVTRVLESRDDSGHGNLSGAIASQSRTVEQLITRLRGGQGAQRENTACVVATAQRISRFVSMIGKIATALQMLTLNARIEAARQRAQGTAFATIADEMRSLAGDVERANLGIGELSEELTGYALKAQDVDVQMQSLLAEAEAGMGSEVARLLTVFEDAQDTSANAARSGVVRAERMVNLTNDILSRLQFQDRMVQMLAEANLNLERTRDFTREVLARAENENDGTFVQEVRSRIGARTVRLSQESELDSSDLEMESGIVTMF